MPIKITYGHRDEGTGQVEPQREVVYGDPDATDEPTGQTEPQRVIEHSNFDHEGDPTGVSEPAREVTTNSTWPVVKQVEEAENKAVKKSTAKKKATRKKTTRR